MGTFGDFYENRTKKHFVKNIYSIYSTAAGGLYVVTSLLWKVKTPIRYENSLRTPWRHREGMEVYLHLTLALRSGELLSAPVEQEAKSMQAWKLWRREE
jgi:hypothetical protein